MRLAKVLGQVVSTVKEPGLERFTLLLLQDVATDRVILSGPAGPAYVAVDLVGAGDGEVVLVAPAVRHGSRREPTPRPTGRSSRSPTP